MTNQERAEQLVEDLFTNGQGRKAHRLVLTQDNPTRDLGGWGQGPLADRIKAAFDAKDAAEQRGESRGKDNAPQP